MNKAEHRIADAAVAITGITVGAGRESPRGSWRPIAPEIEALADAIRSIPASDEAWWAGHRWTDDYRNNDNWRAMGAVGIDLDYQDETGAHAPIPDDVAGCVRVACESGALACNIAHLTPQGARAVLALDRIVTDRDEAKRVIAGAARLVRESIEAIGVAAIDGRNGLDVDDGALDLARIMYAPRAIVKGAARSADVLVVSRAPYAADDLARHAPVTTPPAPRPPVPVRSAAGDTPYGLKALRDEVDAVASALPSGRNDRLNRAAFAIGQLLAGGEIANEESAVVALSDAAVRCGLGEGETASTIRSGLRAGRNNPRSAPAQGPRSRAAAPIVEAPAAEADPTQDAIEAVLPRALWRTLAQVEADLAGRPKKVVLWPGFLAAREVAALAGSPKAGKSDVTAAFIAAATLGTEWLGVQLDATHVVLVSEEGDDDLVKKAKFYGAAPDRLHVLSRDAVGGITPPWSVLIAAAVRRAVEVGATILVVDTFAAWAGLVDDDERSEGVVGPLLKALQPARDAGLATLVVHHLVKAADVRGVASLRGSGAFAASVESIGLYRTVGTDPRLARRSLEVFSRPHGLATYTLERVQPETEGAPAFYRIPSADPASGEKVEGFNRHERTILAHLSKCATWNTLAKVREATGLGQRILEGALPALFAQGKVQRRGDGRKGTPFEYAAPGVKNEVVEAARECPADSPQIPRSAENQGEAAGEDGSPADSPQAPHTPYRGVRAAGNRGPVRTGDHRSNGSADSPHGDRCGELEDAS